MESATKRFKEAELLIVKLFNESAHIKDIFISNILSKLTMEELEDLYKRYPVAWWQEQNVWYRILVSEAGNLTKEMREYVMPLVPKGNEINFKWVLYAWRLYNDYLRMEKKYTEMVKYAEDKGIDMEDIEEEEITHYEINLSLNTNSNPPQNLGRIIILADARLRFQGTTDEHKWFIPYLIGISGIKYQNLDRRVIIEYDDVWVEKTISFENIVKLIYGIYLTPDVFIRRIDLGYEDDLITEYKPIRCNICETSPSFVDRLTGEKYCSNECFNNKK